MQKETQCLSQAVYHEARGESLEGMKAVAQVVFNRTTNRKFPKTICEVVYQPFQFQWVGKTKTPRDDEFRKIEIISRLMLEHHYDGHKIYDGKAKSALFFSVNGFSFKGLKLVEKIGNHRFYVFAKS